MSLIHKIDPQRAAFLEKLRDQFPEVFGHQKTAGSGRPAVGNFREYAQTPPVVGIHLERWIARNRDKFPGRRAEGLDDTLA